MSVGCPAALGTEGGQYIRKGIFRIDCFCSLYSTHVIERESKKCAIASASDFHAGAY